MVFAARAGAVVFRELDFVHALTAAGALLPGPCGISRLLSVLSEGFLKMAMA
jgi:hypothetical protein